ADQPEASRAARLNVTVRPETYARLQEVRNRPGWEINVSQLVDAAINAELDRVRDPRRAATLARLRIEHEMRRGQPYRWGHQEGERWARDVASWAEICRWAMTFAVRDIQIVELEGQYGTFLEFAGRFRVPRDYGDQPP